MLKAALSPPFASTELLSTGFIHRR